MNKCLQNFTCVIFLSACGGGRPFYSGNTPQSVDNRDNSINTENSSQTIANLDQKDREIEAKSDGHNNTYDLDSDKDNVKNSINNCLRIVYFDQLDSDGDGIGDICDDNNGSEPLENIPDEIKNLLPHTWTPISRNTLADVDPCPKRNCAYSGLEGQSGVLNDWTDGVFASKEGKLGGLVVWGGGHRGYYGNEVYFFDLQTLNWSRKSEPTIGQTPGDPHSFGLNKDTCLYYDGNPIAFHTYDSATYIPTTRQFLLPILSDGSEGLLGEPAKCFGTHGMAFDFKNSQWISLTSHTPATNKFAVVEFDGKRNAVWVWKTGFVKGTGGLAKYDVVSKKWTNYMRDLPTHTHATGAIDPIRDLLVVADLQYNPAPKIRVKELAHPHYKSIDIISSGDTEIENASHSKLGFEWVPSFGKFVAWSSGSSLYYLIPPDENWQTNEWVWKKIIVGGKAPLDPVNGPGGKFQVAPKLGIAFVVTNREDSVYAIRLADPD